MMRNAPGRVASRVSSGGQRRPVGALCLSLPGTSQYRRRRGRVATTTSSLAGDWTKCALNSGCVEAAVISGLLAAAATLKAPPRRRIRRSQRGGRPACLGDEAAGRGPAADAAHDARELLNGILAEMNEGHDEVEAGTGPRVVTPRSTALSILRPSWRNWACVLSERLSSR